MFGISSYKSEHLGKGYSPRINDIEEMRYYMLALILKPKGSLKMNNLAQDSQNVVQYDKLLKLGIQEICEECERNTFISLRTLNNSAKVITNTL